MKQIFDDISGNKSKGDTVVTTLNYDLQSVAYQSLGSYDGAVIVMEPQTGKILAMVSKPDYDPNTIAADWESVNSEGSSSLYNRQPRDSMLLVLPSRFSQPLSITGSIRMIIWITSMTVQEKSWQITLPSTVIRVKCMAL